MDPDRGSFLIGRVLGIPVRLHFLFLVLLGAQSLGALVYGKWYVLSHLLCVAVFINVLYGMGVAGARLRQPPGPGCWPDTKRCG